MADDITLTVRVRDLTKGDFAQVRQRLRGMDKDIRQFGASSELTAQRTERLRAGVQGVSDRLKDLRKSGTAANHEMTFMGKTMSLLGRDLDDAARSGELSADEYEKLRNELRKTRLDFDYLSRDIQRHNAIAQRAAREATKAQRDALKQRMTMLRAETAAHREEVQRQAASRNAVLVMLRAETAAHQEEARRQAAIERDRMRQSIRNAQSVMRERKFMLRAETAAYREEARRQVAIQREASRQAIAQARAQAQAIAQAQKTARIQAKERDSGTSAFAAIAQSVNRLRNSFSNASRAAKILMAVMALVGPIAQVLGALLTTVLGGAFIALGAFALRGSEKVKSAFESMKKVVGDTVRAAAAPMETSLVAGIKQVGTAVEEMKGDLTSAFKATGPLIKDTFGAITDLAAKALPGMAGALEDMGPVMEGFRTAMGDIGEGLGEMFDIMVDDGSAMKDVWVTIGKEIKNSLRVIGRAIDDMNKSGAAMGLLVGVFRTLNGIIRLAVGFTKGLESGLSGAGKMVDGLSDGLTVLVDSLGRFTGRLANTFGPLLGSLFRYIGDLGGAILDGLAPALDGLKPVADSAAGAFDQLGQITVPLARGLGEVLGGAVRFLAPIFTNLFDTLAVALPIVKDLAVAVGGPLFDAFVSMTGAGEGMDKFNGGLDELTSWAKDHRAEIDRAFRSVAVSILDMVIVAVDAAPTVFKAFETMVNGVLDTLAIMVNAAVIAFGFLPGIGPKVKAAADTFNGFRAGVRDNMDKAGRNIQEFHDEALPKLRGNRLELSISPYNAALGAAGGALKRAKLSKTGKLDAKWKGRPEVKKAFDDIARIRSKSVTIGVNYVGKYSGFAGRPLANGGSVSSALSGMSHAAGGGPRGNMTLVGENGPEIARLPMGTNVKTAEDTRRMLSSNGGGGGGDGQPIQVNLILNGKVVASELVDPLRGVIRSISGGDVQKALGRN